MKKYNAYKGFTLIEVLIALAIIASSLTVAVLYNKQYAVLFVSAELKTAATWVANNVLTAIDLGMIKKQKGESQMLDKIYQWKADIAPTNVENIRRIRVTVFINKVQIIELSRYKYIYRDIDNAISS